MPSSTSSGDKALKDLQSQQAKILFDKIDELRTIGVGGIIELPQLIVCGDQSSGKSSVLEAISRVRFPTKTNTCTRFATEVVLRRSPEPKLKVSIDPGDSRTDDEEIERLRAFSETLSDSNDAAAFQKLVEKAQEWMGIDNTDTSPTGFSDDVLRVEISGPEKPELTLVDLPGMYHAKSKDQNAEGIEFVRNITEKYMANPRSIILAVLSARFNYHLQDVLDTAEIFDPERERVLAIVTSPDKLSSGSDEEEEYLQCLGNEKVPLQLGWHVLRNRGYEERNMADDERDKKEKAFFETGKWTNLSRENVGIESLRLRLSDILFKHVRRNLPGLVKDIQGKITSHKHNLAKLGAPRSTLQEQRSFLVDISNNFTLIINQGLNGTYEHSFFKSLDDDTPYPDNHCRLRAMVRELNEYFVDAITVRGNERNILFPESEQRLFMSDPNNPRFDPYKDCWVPDDVDYRVLLEEMRRKARVNRGRELPGNSNQLLVGQLFRQQSTPWEKIAKLHIDTVYDAVAKFVYSALNYLTDKHTFEPIFNDVIAPGLEKLRLSIFGKLEELTRHSKHGHPLPVGRNFITRVQGLRNARQLFVLKGELGVVGGGFGKSFTSKDLENATHKMRSMSDDFAAVDIIDQAQAYYETALTTFVDNIAILAIENCLLLPLESTFTSLDVSNMESNKIRALAGEPPYVRSDRDRFTSQLEKLEAGLQTLNILKTDRSSLTTPVVFGQFQAFGSDALS
ncbi:hypothetical protein N7478_003335 [Penicillium angulare]|uniref:uncharacterized protein n=1 Tax=Penicillium angulare TaxID=116970 RepID=UPI002540080D|nr:uncharacterized protein N7478_003335 [Penicillium angulare]KAJ5287649.1 hypothetical protein N7478_003335 [Penicillium angulare]